MAAMNVESDLTVADWIAPRLSAFGSCIGAVIPSGFAAYARVLHPIERRAAGGRARWADVARHTGRELHSLAQFWRLAGRTSVSAADGDWFDGEPARGELDTVEQARLVAHLARHTRDGTCIAAVWAGWGHLRETKAFGPGAYRALPPASQALVCQIEKAPLFGLPDRDYVLFRGRLADVTQLGVEDPVAFRHLTPALLWPLDRSWCVASEVDFDSTLVGGARRLIEAILSDSLLEAFEVQPDQSLAWDGDQVNARKP